MASLQLDTLVYNGHTSGADILWAGVPTLTLPGIKQSARVGASLLAGLGLESALVARNHADYANIAVAAVGKRDSWLARVRERQADARLTAPLFDVGQWVRGMESVCSMAWEVHAMGGRPMHLVASRGAPGQGADAGGGGRASAGGGGRRQGKGGRG